jgi:hypothetical protein
MTVAVFKRTKQLALAFFVFLSGCVTDEAGTATPAAIGHPFQNEPTSFRNIEWGSRLNSADKMTLLGSKQNTEMYVRATDKLNFGDAQLEYVHYDYYKGQFEGVYIKSKPGAMAAMVNTFQAQFGRGAQANQYIPSYLWEGPNAAIYLDCHQSTLTCEGFISSVRVRAEKKADDDAAARGAKHDF